MSRQPDLLLIRHAPIAEAGRLAGRTDLAAQIVPEAIAALAAVLPVPARVVTSPALRCRATAEALFPDHDARPEPRLWEQDFGIHDGAPLRNLPDLGPLDPQALAEHAWEGGESFAAMADRVAPALDELALEAQQTGPIAIVAHAGTVRAALARALGHTGAALAFHIAPLSLTRLTAYPGGLAIGCVNWTAP